MIVESKIVNPFRMGHGMSRIPWSFLLARKNRRKYARANWTGKSRLSNQPNSPLPSSPYSYSPSPY